MQAGVFEQKVGGLDAYGQMSAIAYWQKQQTAPSVRKLFAPMT